MDIRYSTGKEPFKRMNTDELRDEFLITDIFRPDDVTAVYSHVDRIVTMGAMPVSQTLSIDKNIDTWKNFGVTYLLERRELGAINIGGKGKLEADGTVYEMDHFDGIYIPMGTKDVRFSSVDPSDPAKFYMCTTPAHRPYPAKLIPLKDAIHKHLGSQLTSNERTINQYIHPDVLEGGWRSTSTSRSLRITWSSTSWESLRRRGISSCITRRLSSTRPGLSTPDAVPLTIPSSGRWLARTVPMMIRISSRPIRI